jgi:peptidoglycan/LPS O-acetylase OafA/YrhL
MALAVWHVNRSINRGGPSFLHRVVPCWAIAAAAFVLLAAALPRSSTFDFFIAHIVYGLVAVLVLAPATTTDATRPAARMLGSSLAKWLGLISYGIFLWHRPLADWVAAHSDRQFLVTLIATLALSCVCAAGSWLLLERPVNTWAARRFRRSETGRSQAAA